jgi:adenine deaminase
MIRLIPLLIMVLALSGCAHGRGGLLNSYAAAGFSADQESVIAEDLAKVLAEKFPPARP